MRKVEIKIGDVSLSFNIDEHMTKGEIRGVRKALNKMQIAAYSKGYNFKARISDITDYTTHVVNANDRKRIEEEINAIREEVDPEAANVRVIWNDGELPYDVIVRLVFYLEDFKKMHAAAESIMPSSIMQVKPLEDGVAVDFMVGVGCNIGNISNNVKSLLTRINA